MRIGITCYPTYGGSGVVATELGIELAAAGHEVHFISYSQPFRLTGRDDGIFYHEVPVSNYPLFEFPPYDLALASRMAEVAEFCNLDLLHVHYAIPHSVSALLARQMLATRNRRLPSSPRCTARISLSSVSIAAISPSRATPFRRAMGSPASPATSETRRSPTSRYPDPSKSFPTSLTATSTPPSPTKQRAPNREPASPLPAKLS